MIALLGWPSSVYLLTQVRRVGLRPAQQSLMALSFVGAAALSLSIWVVSMQSGVRALEEMGGTDQ